MGIKYLSDEWFAKVEELAEEVNLEVSEQAKAVRFNFTITSDDGDVDFCMADGKMQKGHIDDATTKLTVPREFAYKMFILQDQSAGMQAFTSGKLKVEGDMSKLQAMQGMQPTESQKLLGEKIKEITEE
jgi:putative sterol carrier protein